MPKKTAIEPEHPGIMLKQDFLDGLEIKPGALVKNIGVDPSAVKNIIEGNPASTGSLTACVLLFLNTVHET